MSIEKQIEYAYAKFQQCLEFIKRYIKDSKLFPFIGQHRVMMTLEYAENELAEAALLIEILESIAKHAESIKMIDGFKLRVSRLYRDHI